MKVRCPICNNFSDRSNSLFTCDLSKKTVTFKDGNKIELTPKEIEILHVLESHYPCFVSIKDIFKAVYGKLQAYNKPSIEVHVCHLRTKIKPYNFAIENGRSAGYKLVFEPPKQEVTLEQVLEILHSKADKAKRRSYLEKIVT